MDERPVLVERERERLFLRSAIDAAVSGEPGLVLIHGEAGAGKTTLVRAAAEEAHTQGSHVLLGQCLRFGADVTSYVPFAQAIGQWLRTTTGGSRDHLAPHRRLGEVVPALDDPAHGVAILQIGSLLDALQDEAPTVLVLDDLQWSDPSSLDVLTYLVAGFLPPQRLVILATYRDTDLAEGHRLHGWLADAVRMPYVRQLQVAPMDLSAIEEMLLSRGGIARDAALAEQIYRRSDGNPYLADLLIREAEAGRTDGGPSGGLVEALSASWHRLSEPARKATQLLAVAGTPVALPVLRVLCTRVELSAQDTARAVAEAAEHGIATRTDTGAIWFRHPLLAEVIAGTLQGWERAALHRELASIWQAADDVDERDRANSLALHYVAAGDWEQGLAWSLRAANVAEALRAREEEATHLSTAASLLNRVPKGHLDPVDPVELLLRAGRASRSAGDLRAAVEHYEGALSRVDRAADPLLAGRILLELHVLRDLAGLGSTQVSMAEPLEVLALTDEFQDSPERALAFAHLAFAEAFNGVDEAAGHAETAVRLAEHDGTPATLIWSLATRAQTRWGSEEGIEDAERAFAIAADHGDPQLLVRAAIFLSNSYDSAGRYTDAAEVTERAYQTLRDSGDVADAATVGAMAARWQVLLGCWNKARPLIRELLTGPRSDHSAGAARCAAALLTALDGHPEAASLHLRRAEELLPTAAPTSDPLADTQIQVSLALGDPQRALDMIEQAMAEAVHINPQAADELLQQASRAAAQLGNYTSGQDRLRAGRRLEQIESLRGPHPAPFQPAGPHDVAHPALGALYAAQRAECFRARTEVTALWATACDATRQADMRYEHARALYFLARSLLAQRHDRTRAAEALDTARSIAANLAATPLTVDIDTLVAQTHLHLRSTEGDEHVPPLPTTMSRAVPGLTPREGEILDGLMAGQTYAQIAARLFISVKTVSSHVSNILRKTGTTSRIELAALVRKGSQ